MYRKMGIGIVLMMNYRLVVKQTENIHLFLKFRFFQPNISRALQINDTFFWMDGFANGFANEVKKDVAKSQTRKYIYITWRMAGIKRNGVEQIAFALANAI